MVLENYVLIWEVMLKSRIVALQLDICMISCDHNVECLVLLGNWVASVEWEFGIFLLLRLIKQFSKFESLGTLENIMIHTLL